MYTKRDHFEKFEKFKERERASREWEMAFESHRWMQEIPFIKFKENWQVKIIPNFCGSVIRFLVRTDRMQAEESISVYLDCYDMLGFCEAPYWEAYPIKGETARFAMNDTESLLTCIGEAIGEMEHLAI